MSNKRKKYYGLDDLHSIGDSKLTKKQKEELDKKTKSFFAKRRAKTGLKKKAEKA